MVGASKSLLIDQETVSHHLDEYIEQKKLSIESGSKESKLDQAQTIELNAHLETITYLKVSEICAYVQDKYSISHALPDMRSWLQAHGFSYKTQRHPYQLSI
ncbi:MAG: hypothetical protein ACHP6H_06230 [Legionellales bacterium]